MIQLIQHNSCAKRKNRQSGQGLVEYALAILLIVGVFSVINHSIKKSIRGIWTAIASDIAPGCPGCEPPPEIK